MRRGWVITTIIVIAMAVGGLASWWIIPPSIVRSLPPGQTLVYVNLAPLRDLGAGLPRADDFAAFVKGSGFDPRLDLDAVALSLHGAPTHPDYATAILAGRFGPQFPVWLRAHALRTTRVAGHEAYIFPGWARPQQVLAVVPMGTHELLVTNAAAAEPIVAHAAQWRLTAPALWRAGSNWRTLVAYLDCNAEQLEAARALDGTRPPWRGMERVELRLGAASGGARLSGRATAHDAGSAAAALQWLQSELDAVRPLLREQPGQPSLRGLLDQAQTGQDGDQVWLRLQLDRAALASWSRAVAAR